MRIEVNNYIVVDNEICHGKPTFRGTRVMVWQVLEMLENGSNIKEIIQAYPSLNQEFIQAALHYAVSLLRGRDNVIVPAV